MAQPPARTYAMRASTDNKQLRLKFAAVTINLHHGLIAVLALAHMTKLGLLASHVSLVQSGKKLLAERNPADEQMKRYKLEEIAYKLESDAAKAGISAAEIIFAHAVLDATLHKLCEISAAVDPSIWLPMVYERRVSLKEIKASTVTNIEAGLLQSYLSQLERESLLRKAEALFAVVKPKHTRGVLKGFKYSRERLAALDQLRHDLVHKLRFHQKIRQTDAKVRYLFKSGDFFVALLTKHYKVKPL